MGAKDCCLKGYSKKMGVRLGYDVYKLEDEVWKVYELALMSWLPHLAAVAEVSKKRGHVLSYLTMGWSKQIGLSYVGFLSPLTLVMQEMLHIEILAKYSSNDMVHNHYLEEAKKKTQKSGRNSRPSVMPSARSQSTSNGSKPKPKINNQTSRNWPAYKTSYATTKTVPIAEHSRNSRKFSDFKHFVCSTYQKYIFNANHDTCVTKFLNEVNLYVKVPSNKTMNRNKPIKQISVAKKPERQILKGHRFSIKKTSIVYEKTMTPRSCLRWKPMGKIFKTIGLRWIPTGKIFDSSTTKVDSEPPNGSNEDITNPYECEQTLDVNPKMEGLGVWLLKRLISQKPGLQGTLI
ncbi:hypothetical protein Tco_0392769 [Tanacetum coccineum]